MTIRQRILASIRSVFSADGYDPEPVPSPDMPATITDLDQAIEWAQQATSNNDWPEAVRRWRAVLSEYGPVAPAKVYSRLAIAYREMGDLENAASIVDHGRSQYPSDVRLALNWAQLAMEAEAWDEALERWDRLLERFGVLPPKAYAWLAICHREQGAFGKAAAIIEWAQLRFPDEDRLRVDWVELALAQRNWSEAVSRCEQVLRESGVDAPPKIYGRLAIAHREMGDFDRAASVLDDGRTRYPEDMQLAIDWAQLAAEQDEWEEAAKRWGVVLERFAGRLPARALIRAATEYRHQGRLEVAKDIVRDGRGRFPGNVGLAMEWAQIAMVEGDWIEAIGHWQEVIDLTTSKEERDEETEPSVPRLPTYGTHLDWHEGAWEKLARSWPDDPSQLDPTPTAWLYRAVASVLRDIGDLEGESRVLKLGRKACPRSDELRWELMLNEVELRRGAPGVAVSDHSVRSAIQAAGESCLAETRDETSWVRSRLDDLDRFARHREVLDAYADTDGPGDGLPRIYRLRVPIGSDIELQIRSGRFFTQRSIRARIRAQSEAEDWAELSEGNEPLLERARSVSARYAERYEERPYLPGDVLDDASLFLLYSEMCVHEPIHRVADEIVAEKDPRPIFVELTSSTFTYLNGYAENNLGKFEFGQIYLYFELRRRGANAFLVEMVEPQDVANESPLVFTPSRSLMQARPVESRPHVPPGGVAVVPAGIRSVKQVIDEIGDPLVLSSGFIIKEYAYDRWFRKGRTLELHSGIHPSRSLFPKITLRLWDATHLEGTLGVPDIDRAIKVPVQISAVVGGDWLSWFDHVMHEFLVEMSRRSHAEVRLRGIEEAHVCDHLFAESVIFSAAVRTGGGNVVLWPHSTNPVHSEVRRPGSFDVVHAVTKTGCDLWDQRFSDTPVVHTPQVMLPPPSRDNVLDTDQPLSVVVLGGKTTLGAMPFVHQTEHERSFRRLFSGLEEIRRRRDLEVFYKPKGSFGENERWLESLVDSAAGWTSVTAHPLRIDLPNMLFVSVSVGSSALFEGLSRGIPCMIVRDFASKEYTTFRAGAVPIGPSDEILDLIEECTQNEALQALIERQLDYYREEAGLR